MIDAAFQSKLGLPYYELFMMGMNWEQVEKRMKQLAEASPQEAHRLDTFGEMIGRHLDNPKLVTQVIDGHWMVLLSKVLNAVVSPETKRERLNCATCAPDDFPVLLTVIQTVAYGAPASLWDPMYENYNDCELGLPEDDGPYSPDAPTWKDQILANHEAIARKTWYRPQLVMLVSALWPKEIRHSYYESTLWHILDPEDSEQKPPMDNVVGNLPDDVGPAKIS